MKGETARALAMMYGHAKIASLIDMRSPKAKPGTTEGHFNKHVKQHLRKLIRSNDVHRSSPTTVGLQFIVIFLTACWCGSPGLLEDLSSSEDSDGAVPRARQSRGRAKGPSIHDGPQAIAKFRVGGTSKHCGILAVPLYLSYVLPEDLMTSGWIK